MKKIKEIALILIFTFPGTLLFGISETAYIDSLNRLLINPKNDSSTVSVYLAIAHHLKEEGNYLQAHEQVQKAIVLANKIADPNSKIMSKRAEGDVFLQQGEYVKSQKSFLEALKISREIKDRTAEADILDQLGIIYWYEGDMDKALEYFQGAFTISDEEGDFEAMSGHLNNIGLIYRKKGDYDKAREYYNESADLCRKFNNRGGLANVLNNIGIIYQYESDFEQALDYYKQSLVIRVEINDKIGITTSLGNIGSLYFTIGKMNEAEEYLLDALVISEEIKDMEGIKEICFNLSDVYQRKGDGLKALDYYKKYIAVKEALDNAEVRKQIDKQEMEYAFEKEKLENEKEQQKKDIEADAEIRKQDLMLNVTLGGLLLVIVFAFILFTRFRITNRQKLTIEEKNKEITDSINYARRIQNAILAKEEEIKKYFPESFLLYLPKDIIAGDFYFFETNETHVFYAAADCTGHGVPGALVSVVCSNALTRCVKEFGLTDPGEILTKTRELVVATFEKSGTDVKDGMDISLISMKRNEKSVIRELFWSSANNPLWYIENDVMKEIHGDKQSIGKTENAKSFSTHSLSLSRGAMIFLFTDGFADQFGGEKSKKFKYNKLQNLLMDTKSEKPTTINEKLHFEFLKWKGKNEQTDDVCIIGIRL